MRRFGSDKPDMRFGMEFVELMDVLKGTGEFAVFNDAAYTGGICAPNCASYTRKQLDELTNFVKSQQVGAKGLVYARVGEDGSVKSSVDKFYSPEVCSNSKRPWVPMPAISSLFSAATMPTRRANNFASSVCSWASASVCATRTSLRCFGWSISPCSSTAKKKIA